MGSGCCSVGRAVTFDIRGQRFESSHRLTFILNICLQSTVLYGIDKNKERRGQESPTFLKNGNVDNSAVLTMYLPSYGAYVGRYPLVNKIVVIITLRIVYLTNTNH